MDQAVGVHTNNLGCKSFKRLLFISVVAALRYFDVTKTNIEKVRFQFLKQVIKNSFVVGC
jgi:hypothetical protein